MRAAEPGRRHDARVPRYPDPRPQRPRRRGVHAVATRPCLARRGAHHRRRLRPHRQHHHDRPDDVAAANLYEPIMNAAWPHGDRTTLHPLAVPTSENYVRRICMAEQAKLTQVIAPVASIGTRQPRGASGVRAARSGIGACPRSALRKHRREVFSDCCVRHIVEVDEHGCL